MTFQYFFFGTYPGYFLQMMPFALVALAMAVLWQRRRGAGVRKQVCCGMLAAYLTGLVGVTLLLRPVNLLWFRLIYGQSGGELRLFEWTYDFVPDFWKHFRPENLANALLFVPFGILYPLVSERRSFRRTMTVGLALILGIELLQPVFGRAFDMNDVILNLAGIAVSGCLIHLVYKK